MVHPQTAVPLYHAICEITPFLMLILRYFQCSFYATFNVVFTP